MATTSMPPNSSKHVVISATDRYVFGIILISPYPDRGFILFESRAAAVQLDGKDGAGRADSDGGIQERLVAAADVAVVVLEDEDDEESSLLLLPSEEEDDDADDVWKRRVLRTGKEKER
jgi:hypothetical protein